MVLPTALSAPLSANRTRTHEQVEGAAEKQKGPVFERGGGESSYSKWTLQLSSRHPRPPTFGRAVHHQSRTRWYHRAERSSAKRRRRRDRTSCTAAAITKTSFKLFAALTRGGQKKPGWGRGRSGSQERGRASFGEHKLWEL